MKLILRLLAFTVFVSSTSYTAAQSPIQPSKKGYFEAQKNTPRPLGRFQLLSALQKPDDFSGNYNFPLALDETGVGSLENLFFIPVHPDTLKTIVPTQQGESATINPEMSVGNAIDPTSALFGRSNEVFTKSTIYSIDSINFQYQYIKPVDSVSKTETITVKDSTFAFFVNGMAKDSFSFKTDTTWTIDSTGTVVDSTPLSSVEVSFTNKNNPDEITDTQTVWPAYDVIIQSGTNDTIPYKNPDSTLKNSEIKFNRQENKQVKRGVVDTLIIQLYKGSNPLLFSADSTPLQNGALVNAYASPYYFLSQQGVNDRGYQPDIELEIPLTEDLVTTQDSISVINRAVSLNNIGPRAWNDDSSSLEGIAASTITFKPGYDVQPPDTFVDETADSPVFKHNMFRIARLRDGRGFRQKLFQ